MGVKITPILERPIMNLVLLVTVYQLLALVKGSDNAISFEYQHDGSGYLILKCSLDLDIAQGTAVTMMDIRNETLPTAQKLCWIDSGNNKATVASTLATNAISVYGDTKPRYGKPAYLEILIPDYKPDSDQTFRCEISSVNRDGDVTGTSLKITVNQTGKDSTDEGDLCSNLRTAVIVLAIFCALLLLSLLAFIYWIRRRNGRFHSKRTTHGYFQKEPQSYSEVHDSDNYPNPIYSVSNIDGSHNSVFKSHNSVFKARSNHGSLGRTNSCRQDGINHGRPKQPPPLPPAMLPRGRASSLRSQLSTAQSISSKLQYAQPQDAIGQSLLPQDTGELSDEDRSSVFNSEVPYIPYAAPREPEKRLSCSL